MTFGLETSHNTSFTIQRVRAEGIATISPLDQAKEPGYILRLSEIMVKAWLDAARRATLHDLQGVSSWKDPYLWNSDSRDPSPELDDRSPPAPELDGMSPPAPESDDPLLLTNMTTFGDNNGSTEDGSTEDEGKDEREPEELKGKQKSSRRRRNLKRKGSGSGPDFGPGPKRGGGGGGAGAAGSGGGSSGGNGQSFGAGRVGQASGTERFNGSDFLSNKHPRTNSSFIIQAEVCLISSSLLK